MIILPINLNSIDEQYYIHSFSHPQVGDRRIPLFSYLFVIGMVKNMKNIEIKNCEEELYEKAWDMRLKIKAKSWADFLERAVDLVDGTKTV